MLKADLDLRRRRERRAGHEIEHTDAPYALSYDVVPVLATREAANDVSVDWSWRYIDVAAKQTRCLITDLQTPNING
jgi:hypothetical protein